MDSSQISNIIIILIIVAAIVAVIYLCLLRFQRELESLLEELRDLKEELARAQSADSLLLSEDQLDQVSVIVEKAVIRALNSREAGPNLVRPAVRRPDAPRHPDDEPPRRRAPDF